MIQLYFHDWVALIGMTITVVGGVAVIFLVDLDKFR